jgi:Sulfotransferase domain
VVKILFAAAWKQVSPGLARWNDARSPLFYGTAAPGLASVCSEYFVPGRKINPTPLYIGAGMGRTGTTTMYRTMLDMNVETCHAGVPCVYLPRIAYVDGGPEKLPLNDFASLYPMNSTARGLFDVPVGEFVWDLIDAFPNNRVVLTLRPVSC